jgi:hypothetical protein
LLKFPPFAVDIACEPVLSPKFRVALLLPLLMSLPASVQEPLKLAEKGAKPRLLFAVSVHLGVESIGCVTVTVLVSEPVGPEKSWPVRVTVYVPLLLYVCDPLKGLQLPSQLREFELPSPQLMLAEFINPPWPAVQLLPVAFTVSGALPLVLSRTKVQVGGGA